MVDLPRMARLLSAVAPDARLVLLVDPDQLPAVEAGDVLGALCAAAGDGLAVPPAFETLCGPSGGAPGDPSNDPRDPSDRHPRESGDPAASPRATLLTGHRIHLTRGYRQANAAGIAELARTVQHGEAAAAIDMLRNGTDGVHWIDAPPAALARHLEAPVPPPSRPLARTDEHRVGTEGAS